MFSLFISIEKDREKVFVNLFPCASVFKESFYRRARSSSLSLLAVCQILWPTIHPGKKENRPFSVAVTDKMERTQERMLNFMPSISIYIRNRIKKTVESKVKAHSSSFLYE